MALVKCPECGEEISSQACECVHCGCKIKICPECGAAQLDSADTCRECGYAFKAKEPEKKTAPVKDEQTVKLEKRIALDAKIDKGMSIAKRVIDALSPVLFIVSAATAPVLKDVVPFSVLVVVMKIAFFLMIGVLFPFTVADIIFESYTTVGLKSWLVREKIDPEAYLIKYGSVAMVNSSNEYTAHVDKLECLKTAAFMIRKPNEIVSFVIINVLKFLRVLLLIPLFWWFFDFVDILIAGATLTVGTFFTPITITVIVLFVALSAAKIAVEFTQAKRENVYIAGLRDHAQGV